MGILNQVISVLPQVLKSYQSPILFWPEVVQNRLKVEKSNPHITNKTILTRTTVLETGFKNQKNATQVLQTTHIN